MWPSESDQGQERRKECSVHRSRRCEIEMIVTTTETSLYALRLPCVRGEVLSFHVGPTSDASACSDGTEATQNPITGDD